MSNKILFSNTPRKTMLLVFGVFISSVGFPQSFSINTDGSVADTSAILDVKSTNKGLLLPRMTFIQKNLIFSPAVGLLVYQTDQTEGFYYYNGLAWVLLLTAPIAPTNNTLIYTTKGF